MVWASFALLMVCLTRDEGLRKIRWIRVDSKPRCTSLVSDSMLLLSIRAAPLQSESVIPDHNPELIEGSISRPLTLRAILP